MKNYPQKQIRVGNMMGRCTTPPSRNKRAETETVRGDEFVQVKKYGGLFVKVSARSLFRDGGSTFIFPGLMCKIKN
jgi:hypothetical protein